MAIPAGFARITYNYAGLPNAACNVLCVDNPSDHSAAEIADFANAAWIAHIKAVFSGNLTLAIVLAKKGPDATGTSAVLPSGEAGSVSGDLDPPNTAYLIHKTGVIGGRRGQGRIYMPGVRSADTSNAGVIGSTLQDAITEAWVDWSTTMALDDMDLCLEHADGATPTVVTAVTCDASVATMRRRLRS